LQSPPDSSKINAAEEWPGPADNKLSYK